MMVAATTNDVKGQMAAMRDLGALPADTDLDAVIRDLRLDQAPIDPTTLTGEETGRGGPAGRQGVARLRRPDAQGADALRQEHGVPRRRDRPLAPDLDLLGRDRQHLDDVRRAPRRATRDASSASTTNSMRAQHGRRQGRLRRRRVAPTRLTYRELQPRRELIQKRMRDHVAGDGLRRQVASPGVRLVDRPLHGRLHAVDSAAHLPEATRLIMVKADGCVAIHADGGAYKPLNWMNAPNTLVEPRRPLDGHQPEG